MNSCIHLKEKMLVIVTLVSVVVVIGLTAVVHTQSANAIKFDDFNCIGVANNCGSISCITHETQRSQESCPLGLGSILNNTSNVTLP